MTTLWSLIAAPARGQRRWQLAAVLVLVVIAPLAIVLTLVPSADERPPVALVNQDSPILTGATPVAAGKLLTENLITSVPSVRWVLTDAQTASDSLANGDVLATVTIPSDFSAHVMTIGSGTPEQAELTVQTSTQHGYLGGIVAEALSASLPAGVAAQLTEQYVTGTLSAMSQIGSGMDQMAQGASAITGGLSQAQSGASALQTYTGQLADGLRTMDGVLSELPRGARGLGELTDAGAVASGELSLRLAERALGAGAAEAAQQDVQNRLAALAAFSAQLTPAQQREFAALLAPAQDSADGVSVLLAGQADALGKDAETAAAVAVGAGAISAVSGPVADGLGRLSTALGTAASGADGLAQGNGQLAEALGTLGEGSGQLAQGLDSAQAAIPRYDANQQKLIAQVVARPIGVDSTSTTGPRSAVASSMAVFGPVALWIGAIGVMLALLPFARSALTSAASALRLARSAAVVIVTVALAQSVLVWGAVALSGVAPDRALAAAALTAVTAVAFALVHQGLVAFLPRAGLVVSLVLLGLQVIAAGTLAAPGTTPAATGPLAGLPLSLALQGAQALVGGSLHAVLNAAIGLVLWGAVGALATVLAIRRARARALVASVLTRA
jgi:putative membrane protein